MARLLTSSIESVERLDVLLHLRSDPTHTFTARTLAAALKLPTASVEQDLAILCGRGFLTVSIGNDLLYAYKPISPAIDEVLREVADLNRLRRSDVVAALISRDGKDPVRAFANAFLIRGNKKGDGDA
ncbi:MAG: hypothetical protein KIT84_07665 [Labilithrix sp.]|nr:hypothetical protein [Labilithrix sp.]MCW5810873.1 hypothetical protein [Labilithrix sp.]